MADLNGNRDLGSSNSEVVQLAELGNSVVQITMNDEKNRNSFSRKFLDKLFKYFELISQSQTYKVVILAGTSHYFSTGATQEQLHSIFREEIKFTDFYEILTLALDCPIPVIAAMEGHALGGGFNLGLYADFLVLSRESFYANNLMKYGLTPVGSTSFILPKKLGTELGQEMIYTGRQYRGAELAQRGIPFPVLPRKEVLNSARKLANEIAEKPRLSLITLKQNLTAEIRSKLPEVVSQELEMHEKTFQQAKLASQEIQKTTSQAVQLKIASYGLLKNLTWVFLEHQVPGVGEVKVQIQAVPVNFRDILNALGMLQEHNKTKLGITSVDHLTFGFEAVGVIVCVGAEVSQWQIGDKVMVIGCHDAFSSFIICSANKLVAKPSNLKIIEAATIPIPFFTSYHGLHNLAKIKSGERVLIHAASGGTGQAAVQLAQLWGAEVFATTSPHKIAVLREQGVKHVMNSRTTEFANEIGKITQGHGVDVIFNSLTHGEYIQKNIDILALGGRYIEIGKHNIWSHDRVSRERPDIQYFPFDLLEEFYRDNRLYSHIWEKLVQCFEDEELHPLAYKTFPSEDIVQAFRYLQQSKHIGRVVVTMPEVYLNKELSSYRLANQEQMSQQEELLNQLQSGEVSLEKAEKVLLGITALDPDYAIKNNGLTQKKEQLTQQEAVLNQVQSGEVSLENAEDLLLKITQEELPEEAIQGEKVKGNTLNQPITNKSEEILSLLGSGEISLESAESLLLGAQAEPEIIIKTDKLNITQNTDIAIIGISCRYPGAKNYQEFWVNLKNGVNSVTEPPSGRWEGQKWYHPDPEHPDTSYCKCAGFIDEIDKFDPSFFQISPGEAQFIEPQQRIFLEEAYHAIEDAGYAPDSLKGRQCGVFVGAVKSDYSKLLSDSGLGTHRLALSGNQLSIVPARIAYFLDLRGPVMAVETACSASLVAVHQACESIKRGESELAIAGGIYTMLTPDFQILSSQFQMVSPAGRCKTFDAEASGTVWSEGCGVLLLKSYDRAIRDRDHIYGVIKGTGINYDGNSNGISAPSGQSQTRLEETVYNKFGINPETISYVEAHGTATSLGDPIEVEALSETFSKWTNRKQFCAIGSVKTNIGHASTAAGVSGLIKTILCLKNQKLVPSLHFNQPNPHIDFANSPFYVNTEFQDWKVKEGKPRRAAVSSFGFSGTNAHIVIEEALIKGNRKDYLERPVHLLTLSAKTETALAELVRSYQSYLTTNPELRLAEICYTANMGRTHFNHRLALVAENREELVRKLQQHQQGEDLEGIFSGELSSKTSAATITFLFTGQGSQYVNMGRELYQQAATFREAINQCEEILRTLETFQETSLQEIIYPADDSSGSSLLNQTAYTQPCLFAVEYALCQLWQSWGIKPDAVMGHSVGEYVAATVAGVFSLEDGLKLIAARGRLMQGLPAGGEMVSVMASESKVLETLKAMSLEEKVAIAAINGPQSIVISGESEAVRAIATHLESAGIKTKQLQVSNAFHSPLMEPMLAEFEAVAKEITYNQPQIPLISNVTGKLVDAEITSAEYWVNHLRQPVQFAQSMITLHQQGYELFLEIGPKPILLGMGRQCLPEGVGVWLPSLRPGVDEWPQMLSSLGQLYVQGSKVDWVGFEQDYPRQKLALPTYPFQRERYWVEAKENGHHKHGSCKSENSNTAIVNLLSQGETGTLAQQLEKSANFSPEQLKLLPEILEVLAKQHQEQLAAATIKDWFYQVQWQPLPQTQHQTSIKQSHWLIFADNTGVGEKLAQKLQDQGHECSLVYRADNYQEPAAGTYKLNPSAPEEFEQLYQGIQKTSQLLLSKVIHLWSLDAPATEDLTLNTLEETQLWGCGSVLHLLQTVLKTNSNPQLWLVTRGSQSVLPSTEKQTVAASPLWGLGRVVSLEHPQLWGGLVDLAPQTPADEVEMLLQLLVNNTEEDYLALREAKTYVARLVQQSPQASIEPLSLSSDATYLITGGLGALGLHTAQWLVKKGARNLVLTGRREPSKKVKEIIDKLEQAGCQVRVLLGDISIEQDVAQIIEQIQISLPTLKGVIHAAGVLDDATLQQMSWSHFTKVMAPKVMGTWHLHQLTQNLPLDFFVCFSSMASLIGLPGQGNYAAANAFMDALVHYRRGKGLSGLSINWGAWESGGMAAGLAAQHQNRIHTSGIRDIAPAQGMYALGQLLRNQAITGQVGVISVQWSLLAQQWSNLNKSSLLQGLLQQDELPQQNTLKQKLNQEILEKLEKASVDDRQEILREYIRGQVAKLLGLNLSQLPQVNLGFMEMGMDSLMTVELKNRLQNQLGTTLPGTVAMEYPTIAKLSQYIVEEVIGWKSVEDSEGDDLPDLREVEVDDKIFPAIDEISEEEFAALAAKQLEKLKSML